MNINYFNGYMDTMPKLTSLEEMVSIIRSDRRLQELTLRYRNQHEQQAKRQAPAFCVACLCEGGKAKEHIREVTGLSMVDFDHIPADRMEAVRTLVNEDPHTLISHVTISGEGLRVIFRYQPDPEAALEERIKAYPNIFLLGNRYYEKLTGLPYDEHCSNIGRLTGGAHDPEIYFNPSAETFSQSWLQAQRKEFLKQQKMKSYINAAARKILTVFNTVLVPELAREGKVYQEGSRNQYVSCLAYKLNELGFSMEETLVFLQKEFPDCENLEGVVKSCYRDTSRHGTRHLPRKNARDGKAGTATVDDIKEYLKAHIRLRFNEVSRRLEYTFNMEEGADDFLPIDNRTANSLWVELAQKKNVAGQTLERVLESDYAPRFNPFCEYIKSLPEWHEGDTDYIQQLANTVKVKGDIREQELWHRYLIKWLVGMVAGWLQDDVVNNVILVFIGEQGIYKTTWFQYLLPPALRRYFYTKTNAGRLTKDDLLVLAQYGLVVYEELDTMKAADLNQLKAAVTMVSIDERAPYARFVESRPHIASLAATGNNPQFLSDPTGNRRWLPFEVETIQSPRDCPFPYEGIYSQAIYLYKHGFQYWFSKEEIIEQNKHNSEFETPRLEYELVDIYFEHPRDNEVGVFMTASRALQIISGNLSAKLNPVYIGRAFVDLGFKKVRSHTSTGYLVKERSAEDIKAMQQRIAIECV